MLPKLLNTWSQAVKTCIIFGPSMLKLTSKLYRGKWGNAVMRGKEVFCHYRKTKNGKELLLGQQLHLTMKQIGTKNE